VKKIPAILWGKIRWETDWRAIRYVIKFWIIASMLVFAVHKLVMGNIFIGLLVIFLGMSYILYQSAK